MVARTVTKLLSAAAIIPLLISSAVAMEIIETTNRENSHIAANVNSGVDVTLDDLQNPPQYLMPKLNNLHGPFSLNLAPGTYPMGTYSLVLCQLPGMHPAINSYFIVAENYVTGSLQDSTDVDGKKVLECTVNILQDYTVPASNFRELLSDELSVSNASDGFSAGITDEIDMMAVKS